MSVDLVVGTPTPTSMNINDNGSLGTPVSLPIATTSDDGLMSATDKTKVLNTVTTTGVKNATSTNNSEIIMDNSGTFITSNKANGDTTLKVNNANSSSVGNIQTWQFAGSTKSYIKPDGSFKSDAGTNGTTIRVDATSSSFTITASPTNGWARGLVFRDSTDNTDIAAYGVFGTTGSSYVYGWMGAAYNNATLKFSNVGIGIKLSSNTAPSYPLHLNIGITTGANTLAYFGQNNGSVRIANGSSVSGEYIPSIIGTAYNSSLVGLSFTAQGANSYSTGAFSFNALNATGGTITSDNTFQLMNNGTPQLTVDYQGNLTVLGEIRGASGMGPLSLSAASGVKISTTGYAAVFSTQYLTADQTVEMPNASGTAAAIRTTAPASASDSGVIGEIRVTSTYVYFCIATDTWVRAPFATW